MPVETTWEPFGVYRKFIGSFSKHELKAAQDRVYGDERFDKLKYIISDFTSGEPDDSINEFIAELSAAIASAASYTNRNFRIATVATSPRTLELLKVFMSAPVMPTPTAMIFSTLEEARAWVENQ